MRILFAAISLALSFVPSAVLACDVAGRYRVDGAQAGGGAGYSGQAVITAQDGGCFVRWLPPNTSSGQGVIRNGRLEVRFRIGGMTGTVVYDILPNRVLDGRWWLDRAPGQIGRERLTPQSGAESAEPAPTSGAISAAAGPGRIAQMSGTARGASLQVRMRNIDDIGLVLVAAPGAPLGAVGGAEWSAQNGGGSGTVDLTRHLRPGRNLVALLIHDKRFAFGGHWGYSYELVLDGSTIWSQRNRGRTRGAGIKWWTAFVVQKQANGALAVEAANAEQLDAMGPTMASLNRRLVERFGEERSVLGLVAGAVAMGIMSELLGGSGGAESRNCREVVISGTPQNPNTIVRCD